MYLSGLNSIFLDGTTGQKSICQCRRHKRCELDPWVRKIPQRRKWQPTLVFLPGESHGQRSLVGYSPRSRKESDTAERLSTYMHAPRSDTGAPHSQMCRSLLTVLLELQPLAWLCYCLLWDWVQGTSSLSSHVPEEGREPQL